MLQWGCDLADLLSISSWIEASPEGIPVQEPLTTESAANRKQETSCTSDSTSSIMMRSSITARSKAPP